MGEWVYVRNKKTVPSTTGRSDGWWPEKKKMEILTTYMATGNMRIAASMHNVPYATCEKWKKSEWWKERVAELHSEDNIKLDAKLKRVMDKTLEALEDRVENGDYYIDRRTGKQKRMPANLRDINRVAKDLMERRSIIQKTTDPVRTEQAETVNGRLLKLAEHFAELATGKKPEEKIINEVYEGDYVETEEGETEDAIPEEREAGLQAGAGVGAQEEAEPGEGSSPEECSEIHGC